MIPCYGNGCGVTRVCAACKYTHPTEAEIIDKERELGIEPAPRRRLCTRDHGAGYVCTEDANHAGPCEVLHVGVIF